MQVYVFLNFCISISLVIENLRESEAHALGQDRNTSRIACSVYTHPCGTCLHFIILHNKKIFPKNYQMRQRFHSLFGLHSFVGRHNSKLMHATKYNKSKRNTALSSPLSGEDIRRKAEYLPTESSSRGIVPILCSVTLSKTVESRCPFSASPVENLRCRGSIRRVGVPPLPKFDPVLEFETGN
jgi:hypothetical protein